MKQFLTIAILICILQGVTSRDLWVMPPITIPDFKIPNMTIPDFKFPNMTIPDIKFPNMTIPDIKFPNMTIPNITWPNFTIPVIILPNMTIPDMKIPNIVLPNITLPGVNMTLLAEVQQAIQNLTNLQINETNIMQCVSILQEGTNQSIPNINKMASQWKDQFQNVSALASNQAVVISQNIMNLMDTSVTNFKGLNQTVQMQQILDIMTVAINNLTAMTQSQVIQIQQNMNNLNLSGLTQDQIEILDEMFDQVSGSALNCVQILGLNQFNQTLINQNSTSFILMNIVVNDDIPQDSQKAYKMRQNFRDYFTYAIVGQLDDPIKTGKCHAECFNQQNKCCVSVVATQDGVQVQDNVCMVKQVADSWNKVTLDRVKYEMQCQGIYAAAGQIIKSGFAAVVMGSVLMITSAI